MLSQILEMLKIAKKPISLEVLSQQLHVEKSALEAMLDYCIQKGKIQKISSDNSGNDKAFSLCGGCQKHSFCADRVKIPVYYTIKPTDQANS